MATLLGERGNTRMHTHTHTHLPPSGGRTRTHAHTHAHLADGAPGRPRDVVALHLGMLLWVYCMLNMLGGGRGISFHSPSARTPTQSMPQKTSKHRARAFRVTLLQDHCGTTDLGPMMLIIARYKFSKLETIKDKDEKLECVPGVQAAIQNTASCPTL